ncbi:MAG TPA: DUF1572 family protein [Flavitalea sp.]|nr:DUF1572 family protein [Flavitalea sp.]
MEKNYLSGVTKQFRYYKTLADRSIAQLKDEQLFWKYNQRSNSIAVIIRHMSGNMISRFTNFLTEDGEKPYRNRDAEFEESTITKTELMRLWENGWNCLFTAIDSLKESDLTAIVYIRNEGHTVVEALNRQLSHYPHHVGQIVYIAKMIAEQWQPLSIPPNASKEYNEAKFAREKREAHFTDDLIDDDEKK